MARLAIVLTGRNDDHGGAFAERLLATVAHNSRLLEAAGVPFEYVWVEWNPPTERPLLAETLTRRWPFVRSYVVAPSIHDAICENPNMTILEFFAKNAGLRRTAAPWILTSNADILLGAPLVRAIVGLSTSEAIVYRAVRHDLRPGVPPERCTDPASWQFVHHTTPPFHAEGAGDFLLANRETWHALRGFNETIRFAKLHKDTQLCLHAQKLGAGILVIGDAYHLYHPNSWVHLPAAERAAQNAPWGRPYNYRVGVPYVNPCNWGLADYAEEPIGDRLMQLVRPASAPETLPAPIESGPAAPRLLAEANHAWQLARRASADEFRAEYVAGLARLQRSQADPMAPAVAFLRQYVRTFWHGLLLDTAIREKGVVVYGAGRHTEWLLAVIDGCNGPRLHGILDDFAPTAQPIRGLPVLRPPALDPYSVGAVVVSSDLHEVRIAEKCRALFGTRLAIREIYRGLPTGVFLCDPSFWEAAPGPRPAGTDL